MLNWFSKHRLHNRTAHKIYGSIVTITRSPALYERMKVPDTLEMRFELLMLHMFVFLRWLSQMDQKSGKLRQALVNCFFGDIETTSRQVGVGDLSVPKKMRQLAAVYTKRMETYDEACQDGIKDEMTDLLSATFFSDDRHASKHARTLSQYLERLCVQLDELSVEDVIGNPEVLDELAETAPQ